MEIIYTKNEVDNTIQELADKFNGSFSDGLCVFAGIMKGGLYTLYKIFDKIKFDYTYGFLNYQTYFEGIEPSSDPVLRNDFLPDVKGKHVVLVDDIVDTGKTIKYAYDHVYDLGASNISVVTLLVKKSFIENIFCDNFYYGLVVDDDKFVIGSGMGLGEKYRCKPGIWSM